MKHLTIIITLLLIALSVAVANDATADFMAEYKHKPVIVRQGDTVPFTGVVMTVNQFTDYANAHRDLAAFKLQVSAQEYTINALKRMRENDARLMSNYTSEISLLEMQVRIMGDVEKQVLKLTFQNGILRVGAGLGIGIAGGAVAAALVYGLLKGTGSI